MTGELLIRDLIYFDFDKTASILSQIEGGLIEEYHDEEGKSRDIGGGIDVRLAKIGGSATDTTSKLVVKSVHHDMLVRVEEALFEKGVALDLNSAFEEGLENVANLHGAISKSPYIRAEGYCWFNDYERIKRFINGVAKLADFQVGSALQGIGKADEYLALQDELNQQVRQLAKTEDSNKRRKIETRLQRLKDQKKAFETNLSLHRIDENLPSWMVAGIEDLIDLFMPRRNAFILQPSEKLRDFEVISNLKQDCIVDGDWEHVLFAFGSQPNVKLTVFGLVTSIPTEVDTNTNPFETETASPSEDNIRQLARAFSEVFAGIQPFEQIGQATRFPSVTVYPIAVYRSIHGCDK